MGATKTAKMKKPVKSSENFRYITIIAIIVILFMLFSIISKGFLSFNTVMNIFRQAAAIALAAIGMTFIMLTGGIDLSVGAVIALSSATGALTMQSMAGNTVLVGLAGILVTVMTAVGFGALNGTLLDI